MRESIGRPDSGRSSGREQEAARNDARIHDAARAVLTRTPRATVADVAAAAGVGKSALYLRYPSKEAMLQQVAYDATVRYVRIIERTHEKLDAGNDARATLIRYLEDCVEADVHGFILATAGTFTPSDDDVRLSRSGDDRGRELVARWHETGALRRDADWNDVNDWIMAISRLTSHVPDRILMRRHRMLSALLPGLEPGSTPSLSGTPAIAEDYWPAEVPGFVRRADPAEASAPAP
jgi:AcrR family transcriptional regulator